MASFGETLRRERELRQISLREIADSTKISMRYLEAMEQNRFDSLPGGVFNKGFIRAYAKFIGADGESLVTLYLQETGARTLTAAPAEHGGLHRPPEAPKRRAETSPAPAADPGGARAVVGLEPGRGPLAALEAAPAMAPAPGPIAAPRPAARSPLASPDPLTRPEPLTSRLPRSLVLGVALSAAAAIVLLVAARALRPAGASRPVAAVGPAAPPPPLQAAQTSDGAAPPPAADVAEPGRPESPEASAHDAAPGREPPAGPGTVQASPRATRPAADAVAVPGPPPSAPVPSAAPRPVESAPQAAPKPPPPPAGMAFRIEATAPVWIQVACDGEERVNRSFLAGESVSLPCLSLVRVGVTDAGAVRMSVNGARCASPGVPGARVEGFAIRSDDYRAICPQGGATGDGGR